MQIEGYGNGSQIRWSRGAARHLPQVVVVAFSAAIAMRYCLAAQRDERSGFPLTAAMEWREAAELLASIAPISDRCWREWERIMRLPRHLAGPIGALNAVPYSSPVLDAEAITVAAVAVLNPPLAVATLLRSLGVELKEKASLRGD